MVKISLFGVSRAPTSREVSVDGTPRISFFYNLHKRKSEYSANFQRYNQIKKKTYDNVLTKGGGSKNWRVRHWVLERVAQKAVNLKIQEKGNI